MYHKFTEAVYGSGLRPRNETCLSVVQEVMPIALARPYTEFVLPGAMKGIVEDMIVEVKTAFKERVNTSSWLDSYTKQKCYEKVDNISQRVAYPFSVYHETLLNELYADYFTSVGLLKFMANAEYIVTSKDLGRLHTEVDKTELPLPSTHTTIPRSINSHS